MKLNIPQRLVPAQLACTSIRAKRIARCKELSYKIADIFERTGDEDYIKYSQRIKSCAPNVTIDIVGYHERPGFDVDVNETGNLITVPCIESHPIESVKDVWWCRVPQCPVCISAKTSKRQGLLLSALPKLFKEHPNQVAIFLTLTQRHIPLSNLRNQIQLMSKGWKRLSERKAFPGVGYLRAIEVTKSKTKIPGEISVHPHSHSIVIVPKSYFKSRNYLDQQDWQDMWRQSMKLDYDPIVDVRRAYSKSKNDFSPADVALEAAKYITKFDDLLSFGDALPQFSRQVLGIKTLNSGGIVKNYISQTQLDSIDDKIEHGAEEKVYDVVGSFQLVFDDTINRYRRTCDGKIFNESVIVDN